MLQCVAVRADRTTDVSKTGCAAVCCSVVRCVSVFCSLVPTEFNGRQQDRVCCSVLQRVAACCSVPQCIAVHSHGTTDVRKTGCVALCDIMLQCVAVCCSVLQGVVVCGNGSHLARGTVE